MGEWEPLAPHRCSQGTAQRFLTRPRSHNTHHAAPMATSPVDRLQPLLPFPQGRSRAPPPHLVPPLASPRRLALWRAALRGPLQAGAGPRGSVPQQIERLGRPTRRLMPHLRPDHRCPPSRSRPEDLVRGRKGRAWEVARSLEICILFPTITQSPDKRRIHIFHIRNQMPYYIPDNYFAPFNPSCEHSPGNPASSMPPAQPAVLGPRDSSRHNVSHGPMHRHALQITT